MLSYWACARRWAGEHTRAYTLSRAIPPVLAAIVQWWWFDLRPLFQTMAVIGTILGVYALLYGLEYLWKLLVQSPAALYSELTGEIDTLRAENAELKKPRKTRAEQAVFDQAKSELEKFDPLQRRFFILLLQREEMRYEEIKDQLMRGGFSESLWSSVCEKVRQVAIVETIPPNPLRQYNAFRINPIYRDVLMELLHPED